MSSASSGRYQSRLFNFIHRQSRRLTQKCDRALGQLRVTTSWLGIGLYGLYSLFQSTSAVAKQLHQAVQQLPKLPANNPPQITTPPTSDTPIRRVLLAVDTSSEEASLNLSSHKKSSFLAFLAFNALWGFASLRRFKSLPNSPKNPSSLTHPSISINHPNIQGIATHLSSRSLVLVTAANEILDIFTFQQQQKLQERIIDEVAQYWRYQRLHSLEPQLTTPLLPLSLSSMIAEVQGIIALKGKRQAEGSYTQRALIFLDSTVATLESRQFAPASIAVSLRQSSRELVQLLQTGLSQHLLSIQPRDNKSPARATLNKFNPLAENQYKIQSLILAAINYFFGVSGEKPRVTTTPTTSFRLPASSTPAKLPHNRSLKLPASASATNLASADADPWLTVSDLFGEPLASETSTLHKSGTSRVVGKKLLIPASQLPKSSLRNLLHRFQMSSKVKQSGRELQHNSIGVGVEDQQLPLSAQSASVNTAVASRSQEQIEAQPDWIETDATAIGYVKHPLEQLLEWLDLTLLWLEEMVLKVLQWLQQLWQGK